MDGEILRSASFESNGANVPFLRELAHGKTIGSKQTVQKLDCRILGPKLCCPILIQDAAKKIDTQGAYKRKRYP